MALTRRSLLRAGLASTAVAWGPTFWRDALAATPTRSTSGPYGLPGGIGEHGLRLPPGFRARVLARGGERVGPGGYVWHRASDGQAVFAARDDGWILVSNAELGSGAGGAGALGFDRAGRLVDAYRILAGTSVNCAGGATPWGTWLSCEEHDRGRVWECDPRGVTPALPRPALGVFAHEAAAVDPETGRVVLSEDREDGCLYRFSPSRRGDLSAGVLEVALVSGAGTVAWRAVPDPAATHAPCRNQVAGAARFARGEGLWFDAGYLYLATTSDDRLWVHDVRAQTVELLYDGQAFAEPPLTSVDNLTAAPSGDLFVCQDRDGSEIALVTPEREIAPFVMLAGPQHVGSEATGVSFDPTGTRLYFSSQRAFGGAGAVFEITGPFRPAPTSPPSPAPTPPTDGAPPSPAPTPPTGGAPPSPPPTAPPTVSPPSAVTLRVTALRRAEIDHVLAGGLNVVVALPAVARLRITLRVRSQGRDVVVARAARDVRREATIRLRPDATGRALLRRARSTDRALTGSLRIEATDGLGARYTRARPIRLLPPA